MKNKILDILIDFLTFLKGKKKSWAITVDNADTIVTELPTKQDEFDSLTKEQLVEKVKHFEKKLHLLKWEWNALNKQSQDGEHDSHGEGYLSGLTLAIEILEKNKK